MFNLQTEMLRFFMPTSLPNELMHFRGNVLFVFVYETFFEMFCVDHESSELTFLDNL